MPDPARKLTLYGYWRSSSAYRVRIALNLKGLDYRQEHVHLVRDGGQQNTPEYRAINPLGLVPALVDGETVIVQSLAICEYLEETQRGTPLLPPDAAGRARVRGFVQTVCSEIQPLNNLGVTGYLRDKLGCSGEEILNWYGHWIERGFGAVETWLGQEASGEFCHGDRPTLADCYLVPQVYNAERFNIPLDAYPRINAITRRCRALDAFQAAAPENQADAEAP
jgi:maleylacetoacetate isomerase